ncbi:MAG: hypothetical protein MJZ34_14050 [Paludibacteraceae bacterium]|nr:hypothetical protein [Paludibacteraceae bacterium]
MNDINDMNIEILVHRELNGEDIKAIIDIKDQHWKYGEISQKAWLRDNIKDDDFHIFMRRKKMLVAYADLVKINFISKNDSIECLGLGNLCVDKLEEHKGYGSYLLSQIRDFQNTEKKPILLLCKKSIEDFYLANGWSTVHYIRAEIGHETYNKQIMVYPQIGSNKFGEIQINRNF